MSCSCAAGTSSRWTTPGSEHADGWVLVRDGLVAAVGGRRRAGVRGSARPGRRARHAGPRQHAPPPLPDAHARPRAGLDALRVARRAVPGVGRARRRGRVRRRAHRPRRARALGLLDRVRPPLRLPARTQRASSRRSCRRRASSGCASSPRAARWTSAPRTAACRPDSLVETLDEILADTERVAALADGDLLQIAVAPCSPFSVTRQLMVESAALARRLGLRLHTHLAETADEDEFCRERYGCTPVEYLADVGWLAERRLVRALRARARRATYARFAAHGVGVAHCPASNLRLGAGRGAGARDARRRRPRRPRRRRLGLERARRPACFEVKQALLVGARPRRAEGHDGARGAAARHARRRGRARPRRHRLARAGQARRHRRLAHRRPRAGGRGRPRRRPRALGPPPRRPALRRRRPRRARRASRAGRRGRDRPRAARAGAAAFRNRPSGQRYRYRRRSRRSRRPARSAPARACSANGGIDALAVRHAVDHERARGLRGVQVGADVPARAGIAQRVAAAAAGGQEDLLAGRDVAPAPAGADGSSGGASQSASASTAAAATTGIDHRVRPACRRLKKWRM